jgi:cyanophycinase
MPTPKGMLLIIGGAEDKGGTADIHPDNKEFEPYEILKQLLPKRSAKDHGIEVITTATTIPKEVGKEYQETFAKIGYKKVGVINMEKREEATDEAYVERINKAHAVLFSGGDQIRLSTILAATSFMDAIQKRYYEDPDFIIAGTSAGAMAMAKLMLYRGQSYEAMLMGEVKTSSGLGFIDDCIIDTHFVKRGRIGRLAQAVITNPSYIGLGLGEDTALIVRGGNRMECYGSGMVVILDGSNIKDTNVAYAEEGTPLWVENLVMHILVKGNGYLFRQKKFLPNGLKKEKEED